VQQSKHNWIFSITVICTVTILIAGHSSAPAQAIESDTAVTNTEQEKLYAELESRAADIWGADNVWLPNPKQWVQYEHDLGERSIVDFETGLARVQILIKADDDPNRYLVLAHLRQGVGNLILGNARDPLDMIKKIKAKKNQPVKDVASPRKVKPGKEVRVYLLQKGDSLWKISRRFHMSVDALAKLNNLDPKTTLSTGQPLKVIVFATHDLTLDSTPRPRNEAPLLLDQIRMVDGSPVPRWMVRDFAAEVVKSPRRKTIKIIGADGFERQAVSVEFELVTNHLEIRARKFHPLVSLYAKKYNLDPAVIMAIIHTESRFNPRARSRTPAYGLMQLVPNSGALDAYHRIYGEHRELTSKYLYDPKNNIELGVTYFNVLKNRYLKSIKDPASRTFCAVAAYNAGAANVGRAFIDRKSIQLAAPTINLLKPQEVYTRLVEALPFNESRKYVKKVVRRRKVYRNWQSTQMLN